MLSKLSSFVFALPTLIVRIASILRRPSRTALRLRTFTISLLLAYLTMAQGSALAQQGCTVTSTADSGSGTLRACVAAQPRTIGFNLPPLSIITLATPITIDLTSYSESIGLTIQGPSGGGVTISGGGNTQIFQTINGDLSTSITLSNLIFTGGHTQGSGGAILDNSNNGNLTLSNTTFYGNYAGVAGSALSYQGSTVRSILTIQNSTFAENTGPGAALAVSSQSGTVSQTTVSGNTGGMAYTAINGSTGLAVTSSIVAANGTGTQCSGCSLDATDYTGPNPMLGQLQYNGGNLLETMLPLPGSPALGLAGGSTTPDERGFPAENPGDSGAVQTKYITVDTLSDVAGDTGTGACVAPGGTCSLREAINFGNLLAGFGTSGPDITFAPALFASATTASPATITLGASLPNITGPIDIAGPGANLLAISGANQYQVAAITSSGSLALNGTTLTQGNESTPNIGQVGSGGTLFTEGLLTLSSSAITAGSTLGNGGAIFGYNNAVIALSGSTLSGNTANSGGGAIYIQGLALQISNSTINGNTAYLGGALEVLSGTLTIVGSTISGNSAVQYSGVADRENDSNYLANDIIEGNSENENESDVESSYTDGGGNLISTSQNVVDPGLAPLAYNGGPTQTMLPLPGSPAICAGTAANRVAYNLSTDQRGATHSSAYCAATEADSGAVQTSYSALAFVQQPTNTLVNAAITPSPLVTVTEDSTNAAGIPVPLTLSTGGSGKLAGTATESTVLGGPATFGGLSVIAPSTSNTLDALLNITPQAYSGTPYTLSATSNNFIVSLPATQLAFGSAPPAALAFGGNAGTVIADEEDSSGNIVNTASDTITLSVSSTGGYSATYTAAASSGVASFNLSGTALAPGSYTYTASYSTLTPATAVETVSKATPAITVASSSIAYGTASTTLSAGIIDGGRRPPAPLPSRSIAAQQ